MIKVTKELLSEWYWDANDKYFNGELKREPKFRITNSASYYGSFSESKWALRISVAYIRSERDYKNTFLHELCHLYVAEKYSYRALPHGIEWQKIADAVTHRTGYKYGPIRRCGGGLDKSVLRNPNTCKFVVFTDYKGVLSVGKYSNGSYVSRLKSCGCVGVGTNIYYFTSRNEPFINMKTRRSDGKSLYWNYTSLSLDEIKAKSTLCATETYNGSLGMVG